MKKYLVLFLCFILHVQASPWEDPKYDGLRYKIPGTSFSINVLGEDEGSPKITGRPINAVTDTDFVADLFAHPVGAQLWEDGPVPRTDASDEKLTKRLGRYQARGAPDLLSWWVFFVDNNPCGFVGAHRYLDEGDAKATNVETKGLVEICYFMAPEFWGRKVQDARLSDILFQTFCMTQLKGGLDDRCKTVYAPINPENATCL